MTVKVNGKFEVLSVRISEEAMKLNDREMLEDLVAAATNQAITKVRQQLAEESREDGRQHRAAARACWGAASRNELTHARPTRRNMRM